MTLSEALLVSLFLGLGTARMAAIISLDEIAAPFRDLVFHWYPPEDNDAEGWFYQWKRKATGTEREQMKDWDVPWWQKRWSHITQDETWAKPRKPTFVGKLLGCPKCTAVWIAGGNVALYYVWRDAAIVLNVVMAASFLAAAFNHRYYK